MIVQAFLIGLFGSLHCVGMCGPIALALPLNRASKATMLAGAALYNLGRALTYAFMGLIIGYLGLAFKLVGLQRWVSIGVGILLILYVVRVYVLKRPLVRVPWVTRGVGKLKAQLFQRFNKSSYRSLFLIGVLNGWLPCGFVYIALLGAMNMAHAGGGATYMLLFGLGTAPLMMAVNVFGSSAGAQLKAKLLRLVPFVLVFFGILLVVRGMSLGIPFLSPEIVSQEPAFSGCH